MQAMADANVRVLRQVHRLPLSFSHPLVPLVPLYQQLLLCLLPRQALPFDVRVEAAVGETVILMTSPSHPY